MKSPLDAIIAKNVIAVHMLVPDYGESAEDTVYIAIVICPMLIKQSDIAIASMTSPGTLRVLG